MYSEVQPLRIRYKGQGDENISDDLHLEGTGEFGPVVKFMSRYHSVWCVNELDHAAKP